jgi:DNA-binding beta-propeller fold protein YncE
MGLYGQGRLREALDAFDRARVLSPTHDPRIEGMLSQTRAQLTPSPTPVPPASTPTLEPTAFAEAFATPSEDLGAAYFGQVFLTVAPGPNVVPAPMTEFFGRDQLAIFIELLDQRWRLPFILRIVDLDGRRVVAELGSDAASAATAVRFSDKLVWYHQGGEAPGRYQAQLYAGDVLTHRFNYVVGSIPLAMPTPVPIAATPFVQPPIEQPQTTPTPQPQTAPALNQPLAAAPPAPLSQAARAPVLPTPTAVPPRIIRMSNPPAALDFEPSSNRLYVADTTGLVWALDGAEPELSPPLSAGGEPTGLAADERTGRLYIPLRSSATVVVVDAATGQRLGTVSLPAEPGDMRMDPALDRLYVLLPQTHALAVVDLNTLKITRVVTDLPDVSGIALDSDSHLLFISHTDGELSIFEGQSASLAARLRLTDVGLSAVAAAREHAYAINTPGHELIVVDLTTGPLQVSHIALVDEPLAIAVAPDSAAVFVLTAQPASVVRIDTTDGREVGRVQLEDSGPPAAMTINPADGTLMVAESTAGIVAVIPPQAFRVSRSPELVSKPT